uniref:Candidate secreted effector n=1 Tax=Meloidogyne incognita TaxID=6306 RepID=A0A914M8X2_MELIC
MSHEFLLFSKKSFEIAFVCVCSAEWNMKKILLYTFKGKPVLVRKTRKKKGEDGTAACFQRKLGSFISPYLHLFEFFLVLPTFEYYCLTAYLSSFLCANSSD